MEKSEIKGFIAKRVAQELKDGDVVNLGIGAIGGAAVDAAVVLGHQDGLVLEGGGDVHMVGLQLVN